MARRFLFWGVLLGVVAIYLFAIFPTRGLFSERNQLSSARTQLATLTKENAQLSKKVANLNNPSVIASLARSQYGMVNPGQQGTINLPTPTPSASKKG